MDRPRPNRLLELLPIVLAAALVAEVLGGFAARLAHPYDLEWMEGGMLAHAWRLQRGLALYPDPGPDFVPFVYPPGYTSLLALLGTVGGGLSHALGRALAIVGTLAAAAAIVHGVARHGGSRLVGALAAAVFLGTWPASGAFFDLVRPDSLAVAFLAWAIVLGLDGRRGTDVAAGLLLAAAWACKHNAAAYGLAMLLGIAVRDGWVRGVVFGLSAGLPALAISLYMQLVSDGRFLAYLLGVPGSHPTVGARIFPGTPGELAQALPFAVALGAGYAVIAALRAGRAAIVGGIVGGAALVGLGLAAKYPSGVLSPGRPELIATLALLGAVVGAQGVAIGVGLRRREVSWRWVYGLGVVATALVTAGLMRGHHGGFLNVHMPMHWVIAFSAGIAAAAARRRWPGATTELVTAGLISGQLLLQLGRLDLAALLPTPADVAAGDRVVAAIRERCDGPVFSPYAAWLPAQAGLAPSAHLIAIWDINHPSGPFRPHMRTFQQAASDRYWDCLVEGGRQKLGFDLGQGYAPAERFNLRGKELMPRTGWRVRPTELEVRED